MQEKILLALWPLLKPGGTLLYATCSIMPEENHLQIKRFTEATDNARLVPLAGQWGYDTGFGKQLFANANNPDDSGQSGDGFFYSLMIKTDSP